MLTPSYKPAGRTRGKNGRPFTDQGKLLEGEGVSDLMMAVTESCDPKKKTKAGAANR
jgi:hypothetical protein